MRIAGSNPASSKMRILENRGQIRNFRKVRYAGRFAPALSRNGAGLRRNGGGPCFPAASVRMEKLRRQTVSALLILAAYSSRSASEAYAPAPEANSGFAAAPVRGITWKCR